LNIKAKLLTISITFLA